MDCENLVKCYCLAKFGFDKAKNELAKVSETEGKGRCLFQALQGSYRRIFSGQEPLFFAGCVERRDFRTP